MGNQMLNWRIVQEKHTSTYNFLKWASEKYGLNFDYEHAKAGVPVDLIKLVDEFYDVDRTLLEAERAAVIAGLNKSGNGTVPD